MRLSQENQPEFVITDIMTPERDGLARRRADQAVCDGDAADQGRPPGQRGDRALRRLTGGLTRR